MRELTHIYAIKVIFLPYMTPFVFQFYITVKVELNSLVSGC